eukprot:Gb_32634 [translate_table: standard]
MAQYQTVSICEVQINCDCEEIYKACKGLGTDEERLIRILSNKNAVERELIREAYHTTYKEDLVKRLRSELSGKLEKAMILWLYDPAERDAILTRQALLMGFRPDCKLINEIFCSRTSSEILVIREVYYCMYNTYLRDDIVQRITPGHYQKLLLALASGQRCVCRGVDTNLAQSDANALYDAGSGRIGTDEETIIKILTERSLQHLRTTFGCYQQIYGQDIKKALNKETHGQFEDFLRLLIKCICCPEKYFAKVLYQSMKGLGTDDDTLIRVVVTRAEVDISEIKGVYMEKYRTSLEQAIRKDTSRHYRSFLLALLAHEQTCKPIEIETCYDQHTA